MRQRILTLLLAAGVCLGIIGSFIPSAQAFSDVGDGQLAEAVEVLSGLGIVSGYSDGSYHPGDTLTRAQFCKLAVLAEGNGDQVTGSAYRTLFSDVPASNWAAPYVNLAYEEGLVAGYGDGTFGPDDGVTAGQAATIVLHMLGYENDDIGPFWPEDYMEKAASLGLLDGVDKPADQILTRGDAALLLYNMLRQDTADGQDYLTKLCASTVENAVLLDNDAEAEDGTLHTAQVYANGTISCYVQDSTVPDALVGRRGTLLLSRSGEVSGFLPDELTYRRIVPAKAEADGITDENGYTYTISSSTVVALDDEVSTYGACWYELEGREEVVLYYAASGGINLISASPAVAYSGVTLTGYYESASPNTSSPSTITILGITLDVADGVASSLARFDVGDQITVVLNGAGEVSAAYSTSEKRGEVYGVLESASSGTVALTCGLTAKGTITSGSVSEGDLVRVTSSGIGKLTVTTVSATAPGSLNVAGRTLGSIPLADQVTVYERVGESAVVEVDYDSIVLTQIAASKIDFYATDDQGRVNLLLLDDATGDAYTYGLLETGTASGGSGSLSYSNRTVTVENSGGLSQSYFTGLSIPDETMGGIAVTDGEKVTGYCALTKASGVSRSAFDSTDAVVVDGVRVPISGGAEVYNESSDSWGMSVEEAKGYADSFTVYYSGTLGQDAQVRIICIN